MAVRNWTEDLTRGSHREVLVLCDWQLSETCRHEWAKEWRTVVRDREHGDGSDICMPCSRARKTGKDNPNCRYPDLNEGLLETIDTEAKAYLLGWLASDGALQKGTATLEVHRRDRVILEDLGTLFSRALPLARRKGGRHVALCVSRQRTIQDVCRHLNIEPGPKSRVVGFPALPPDLERHFIRGLLDGDGSIRDPRVPGTPTPECAIASSSEPMRQALRDKTAAWPSRMSEEGLQWQGVTAIDFLGHLYEGALWKMERKHALYQDWCTWAPQMGGAGNSGFQRPLFYWSRLHPDGVSPSKTRISDSGYDLTLIGDREEDRGRPVRYYRTGIRVSPLHGWYFDLVPRSSISKTGYMLANSVGVIDRSYRGEVLVALRKMDPDAPDIEFPCRLVQLVPRPIIHLEFEEVDEFDETERGSGGFGSTGA